MASCPITSWQIKGERVEAVTDFLFLGSKITEDSDCSHEIRRLLLGRKATDFDHPTDNLYLWDPNYSLPSSIPRTYFLFLLRVTKAMY